MTDSYTIDNPFGNPDHIIPTELMLTGFTDLEDSELTDDKYLQYCSDDNLRLFPDLGESDPLDRSPKQGIISEPAQLSGCIPIAATYEPTTGNFSIRYHVETDNFNTKALFIPFDQINSLASLEQVRFVRITRTNLNRPRLKAKSSDPNLVINTTASRISPTGLYSLHRHNRSMQLKVAAPTPIRIQLPGKRPELIPRDDSSHA